MSLIRGASRVFIKSSNSASLMRSSTRAVATVASRILTGRRALFASSLPISRAAFNVSSSQSVRCFSTSPSPSSSSNGYHSVVVSIAGPDRPGIVKDVATILSGIEANIEESRMTVLGQDFAIIVLVTLPASHSAPSIRELLESRLPEFAISSRATVPGPQAGGPGFTGPVRILQLAAEGPDQPGVVKKLTEFLTKYAISIRDLETDTSSAPFAGYKVFGVKSILAIPTSVDLNVFHDELQSIGNDLGFEVALHDPNEEPEMPGMEDEQQEEEEEEEAPPRRVAASSQAPSGARAAAGARTSSSSSSPASAAASRTARLAEMEAQMRAAAQARRSGPPPPRR